MSPELLAWVPTLNTALIVVSGAFLVLGYILIRRRQVAWHHRSMLAATVFAGLFLVVYVTRALLLPTKFFPGEGLIRVVYLATLATEMRQLTTAQNAEEADLDFGRYASRVQELGRRLQEELGGLR
jgi:uncharacterized membrane protein YozB (DUF420 family)